MSLQASYKWDLTPPLIRVRVNNRLRIMGVCPSRAPRREGTSRSTQTTHAYNCHWNREGRYYNYVGAEYSEEAPGIIVITNGYVRDVATQGPTTCISKGAGALRVLVSLSSGI